MRTRSGPSQRPRPTGLSVLRADERFVETFADLIAERVAERLERDHADEGGYLDTEGAARHLCTNRKRIYELTSAGVLRPAGYDGRRPLFRRAGLDGYVEEGGDA
jgi:hypothetical protein